jgi:hypothetical protein
MMLSISAVQASSSGRTSGLNDTARFFLDQTQHYRKCLYSFKVQSAEMRAVKVEKDLFFGISSAAKPT